MKIAGAALNQTPLAWEENLGNILNAIRQAKQENVDILCLPELTITGYGCEDMFLHPWVAEKAGQQLLAILPETSGITVSVGLPMWYEGRLYNVVALIRNKQILGFQAKQNLPKDGVHYEPRWFEAWPGERREFIQFDGKEYKFGDYTYTIDEAIVGFEICEDAWVEDRPACRLVEKEVNLILNPSASHFAIDKFNKRESLITGSSENFRCTYIYANQLGNEAGRIIYDGDVIIAQQGKLLANLTTLSFRDFEVVAVNVNLNKPVSEEPGETTISSPRQSNFDEFTDAVSLGLIDYLRKSRSKGFVLSLSGGADSSSCLVLVSEMVRRGIEVHGVTGFLSRINREDLIGQAGTQKEIMSQIMTCAYQGTQNSSQDTYQAAELLAKSVGATFYHWSVDEEVENASRIISKVLNRQLTWETDDLALQNIQARSRSPLIWMLANIKNCLLLTTSNRSEGSVGYTTMDGDTSGSLAPLAGIDKAYILKWLDWMYKARGYKGLSLVQKLQPSAELRPAQNTQTDEADLMPYSRLNEIEELFALQKLSPTEIYQRLRQQDVDVELASQIIKFFQLWSRNQWKRERLAPSFQLSKYNIDPKSWFRFPILSGSFQDELKRLKELCA